MTFYDLQIRPIDTWPDGWRTPRERKATPFQTKSYTRTLELLRYEIDRLEARDAHLQVDCTVDDLRRDGMLRAHAKVDHPGVILTVDSRQHGVLTYPCDTFEQRWASDPPSWQINLRAIALGLEALRKVDRYGIAERGQQYAGFGALPPGPPVELGPAMTVEQAARFLCRHGGPWTAKGPTDAMVNDMANRLIVGSFEAAEGLYRIAAKRLHPDHDNGDPDLFRQLTAARDLIRRQTP